jgi:hypothetical protein
VHDALAAADVVWPAAAVGEGGAGAGFEGGTRDPVPPWSPKGCNGSVPAAALSWEEARRGAGMKLPMTELERVTRVVVGFECSKAAMIRAS